MKFGAIRNTQYIDKEPRYLVKEYQTKSILVLNCGTELMFKDKKVAEQVAELLNKNYREEK